MFLELNLEWLNLKFFIDWLFWIFDDVYWAALYLDFRILHKNVIMLIIWVMWVFLNLNLISRWIPGVLLFLAAVIALHGTEDYLIFIFLATFFNWIAWCNKFILWNYLLIMQILNFLAFLYSLPASLSTILQSFRSLKFRKYLLSFDLFILSLWILRLKVILESTSRYSSLQSIAVPLILVLSYVPRLATYSASF